MKKITPNIAKPTSETTVLATVNTRFRNSPSGTIGSGWRSSQNRNSVNRTAAVPRKPSVYSDVHEWLVVSISAHTSENNPPVTSSVPTTSSVRVCGSRLSTTAQTAAAAAATPIGTLIQNT